MIKEFRKLIFLAFMLLFLLGKEKVIAQNLVPNPSFEDKIGCPFFTSQIYNSPPWYSATGTIDYFNSCDTTQYVGVPINLLGSGVAHSGNAYAGFGCYLFIWHNVKEFIEVPLIDTLKVNTKYYISFYISLADSVQYAISDIGACLTSNGIGNNVYQIITLTPQVQNPIGNFLSDKSGWIHISDTITAFGNEKFLAIGSFKNDSISPDTLFVGSASSPGGPNDPRFAYYFLDDVSVTEIPTGIINNEQLIINNLSISPNPTSGKFRMSSSEKVETIEVYNVLGEIVYFENQDSRHESQDSSFENQDMDISAEPAGVYFVRIRTQDHIVVKKLVKSD